MRFFWNPNQYNPNTIGRKIAKSMELKSILLQGNHRETRKSNHINRLLQFPMVENVVTSIYC